MNIQGLDLKTISLLRVPIGSNGNTEQAGMYDNSKDNMQFCMGMLCFTYSNKIGKDLNLSVAGWLSGEMRPHKDQQSNTRRWLVSENWFAMKFNSYSTETSDTRKKQLKYAYLEF